MKFKNENKEQLLSAFFYIFITFFCVFTLLPFVLVISSSFTDEIALLQKGFRLFPAKFSLEAYRLVFRTDAVYNGYKVTAFVTIVGTCLSLILTSLLSYSVSSREVKYRNHINFYVYFTMLFHGGMVPMYILITRYLHLKNTIWVLIIPCLINPWNFFLLRNFFRTVPHSIPESAKIDGANDFTVLIRIIMPLSKPALATIGLFYALAYWNDWYRALLFIDHDRLYPLQYIILRILRSISILSESLEEQELIRRSGVLPSYGVRFATTVVTIGPIVLLYPFVQRYFVKGITIGGVKG